jgi:endonuclease-3 related protein
MHILRSVYKKLLAFHGPQGWWPIINPSTSQSEYHLSAPRNESDFFEIAIGAILTQNIAWNNVNRALISLKARGLLDPQQLRRTGTARLARIIRPTGYYNQKAKKIKNFINWYGCHGYRCRDLSRMDPDGLRKELLNVNGIGPETADSILLYAFNIKIFVVDAYTRRIFTRLGLLAGDPEYQEIQDLFHRQFKGSVREYNEYHALIVAHGKNVCKKKPLCGACCLQDLCQASLKSKR